MLHQLSTEFSCINTSIELACTQFAIAPARIARAGRDCDEFVAGVCYDLVDPIERTSNYLLHVPVRAYDTHARACDRLMSEIDNLSYKLLIANFI